LDAHRRHAHLDGDDRRPPGVRRDRFAELVARVATDPDNPSNIERYLWVLDEPSARHCDHCRAGFDPWSAYDGGPARGLPRRYCAPRCAWRAAERRRRGVRPTGGRGTAA
jgi:hypothetical protein